MKRMNSTHSAASAKAAKAKAQVKASGAMPRLKPLDTRTLSSLSAHRRDGSDFDTPKFIPGHAPGHQPTLTRKQSRELLAPPTLLNNEQKATSLLAIPHLSRRETSNQADTRPSQFTSGNNNQIGLGRNASFLTNFSAAPPLAIRAPSNEIIRPIPGYGPQGLSGPRLLNGPSAITLQSNLSGVKPLKFGGDKPMSSIQYNKVKQASKLAMKAQAKRVSSLLKPQQGVRNDIQTQK